ncbi:MAG: dockerin type I repeat-containing protein [Pirellulales bacterium]
MKRRSILAVAAGLVLCAAGQLSATTITHNGSADSLGFSFDPLPGTGAVNVSLNLTGSADFYLSIHSLDFRQVGRHEMSWTQDFFTPTLGSSGILIVNHTAVPWGGYRVDLTKADFRDTSNQGPARVAAPVVPNGYTSGDIAFFTNQNITLRGSSIVRDGNNASLSTLFDDPVDPGEAFFLTFGLANLVDAQFIMAQEPQPLVSGDTDKDGNVDIFDVAVIQTKYGTTTGATWADGDFDGNGTVDIFDVALLQVQYGYGIANAPAPVPEPSAIVLAVIGLAGLALCGRHGWPGHFSG